jgi:hypothetical protein
MQTTTPIFADGNVLFSTIEKKLTNFVETQNIPHIIFYGASGTGKRRTVHNFIMRIYKHDRRQLKNNVLAVNCAHGKGIKFIRENVKNFARANIQTNNGTLFKTIVLYNADKLTIDAQSALRRCIEIFSRSTRFFIVVENKHKLFNPILSRFCEIYFPIRANMIAPAHPSPPRSPAIDIEIQEILDIFQPPMHAAFAAANTDVLPPHSSISDIPNISPQTSALGGNLKLRYTVALRELSQKFYNRGLSAMGIVEKLRNCTKFGIEKRISLVLLYQKIKSDIRNEKFLIFYLLDFLCLRSNAVLKSITDM